MLRRVQLIVWDWNGTVVADSRAHLAATNSFIRLLGGREVSLTELQAEFGLPVREFYLGRGCDPGRLITEVGHWYEAYERLSSNIALRRGVRIILCVQRRRRRQNWILSNNTVGSIERQLDRLQVSHFFRELSANCGQLDVVVAATKLDRLRELLAQYSRYQPHQVVIIGDSLEEIEIAQALGATSIAVGGGVCSIERLKAAEPDILLGSLEPIARVLATM
ncbi:HAD family hydrolase [Candidatus Berkelbacteria bacterium]|nr:HAD family hydrolase [Candidatus Berkelbacteria bacterium]